MAVAKFKLNKTDKATWTTALRSGEYKQGEGALRSLNFGSGEQEYNFCCLGVAQCAISGRQPREEAGMLRHGTFGLGSALQSALAEANDGDALEANASFRKLGYKGNLRGTGFRAIATWIEKNL